MVSEALIYVCMPLCPTWLKVLVLYLVPSLAQALVFECRLPFWMQNQETKVSTDKEPSSPAVGQVYLEQLLFLADGGKAAPILMLFTFLKT